MADLSDSSSVASFSDDESDIGTPSDECIHCLAKLDPNNLIVDVKTRKITARCVNDGCRRENRLGRWSCRLPVDVLK